MNTIKDLAIKWWEDLSNREKAKLTFYFDPGRRWEWLFEAEIESIFYQEVIVKWFSSKTYHEQHELSDLYFDSRNPSLFIAEQVKEMYLKEHSKEEPALDFKYCKNEIEGGNKCYVQCDHCKEYYAPLEMEQSLSVNKDVEVDEERIYPCLKCSKLRTKAEGGTTFSVCEDCWDKEQPKVEDNSWDEVRKNYFNYVADCRLKGITYLDLFKWLEQHYTLIKKQ